jgi:hypothetical protein
MMHGKGDAPDDRRRRGGTAADHIMGDTVLRGLADHVLTLTLTVSRADGAAGSPHMGPEMHKRV